MLAGGVGASGSFICVHETRASSTGCRRFPRGWRRIAHGAEGIEALHQQVPTLPAGVAPYWSESGDSVAIHESAVAGIAVPAGQSVLLGGAHIALVVDDGAIGNNLGFAVGIREQMVAYRLHFIDGPINGHHRGIPFTLPYG